MKFLYNKVNGSYSQYNKIEVDWNVEYLNENIMLLLTEK